MKKINTNILVVGSGLSGAIAALAAAEENKNVILITKCADLLSGNTPYAQGGIIYPDVDDPKHTFKQDVMSAGHDHNNEVAVDQLAHDGPKLIESLLFAHDSS